MCAGWPVAIRFAPAGTIRRSASKPVRLRRRIGVPPLWLRPILQAWGQCGGSGEIDKSDLDRGAGARYLPAPVKAFLTNSFGYFWQRKIHIGRKRARRHVPRWGSLVSKLRSTA